MGFHQEYTLSLLSACAKRQSLCGLTFCQEQAVSLATRLVSKSKMVIVQIDLLSGTCSLACLSALKFVSAQIGLLSEPALAPHFPSLIRSRPSADELLSKLQLLLPLDFIEDFACADWPSIKNACVCGRRYPSPPSPPRQDLPTGARGNGLHSGQAVLFTDGSRPVHAVHRRHCHSFGNQLVKACTIETVVRDACSIQRQLG